MNRKTYGVLLAIVLSTLSFLTSCSSSSSTPPPPPPPQIAIAATSGTPQTATVSTPFAAPLVATVTTDGNPTQGVTVTFTAPSSGASGTFAGGTNTATTDANGVATSAVFTANSTAGAYTVTALAPGALAPANFSLTNNAVPVETIIATSGSGQSATVSTAFAAPLVATIMTGSTPNVGVVVTFTAPSSGASGTFADSGTAVTTATTNSSGVATSAIFTANPTAGPYNVVATATGAISANFSLTNTAVVTSNNYTFYLSGEDNLPVGSTNVAFVALAGTVTIDSNGNVLGGEQDYNDANTANGGDTSTDTITGGSLTVDSTGQGTLTLITDSTIVGNPTGTETLAIQFVNTNHALVMQFDGSATSSGSLDLQTPSSTLAGGYSFVFSGVDSVYSPAAFGGVFSISGTALTGGVYDFNDAGVVGTSNSFTATANAVDSFGRGTITGATFNGIPMTLAYYIVGPEVIRIIDTDTDDSAVGSAFGQGATAFTNASLGSSVLSLAGNPFQGEYGALGQLTTSNTSTDPADLSGVGEDNELDTPYLSNLASVFLGTYSITANGYGNLTITGGLGGGSVSALGVYATDPALNLNDPNNTASGGGGALALDLDPSLAGGTGVLIPQSDAASTSFAGNYVAGWQDFNYYSSCSDCEFDTLAQGSMVANGALSLTGPVSDPFFTLGLGGTGLYSGNTFSGTPLADTTNVGRYSMLSTNTTPNSLNTTIDGVAGTFDLVMYQASGGQLYWMEYDTTASIFTGPLEQQGDLTGLPLARKPATKPQRKQKR
jgi:hypothetical protein